MLHAWIFGPVIITVGCWEQVDAETEVGCRVEIRRVQPSAWVPRTWPMRPGRRSRT